jgi:hypothetical protein
MPGLKGNAHVHREDHNRTSSTGGRGPARGPLTLHTVYWMRHRATLASQHEAAMRRRSWRPEGIKHGVAHQPAGATARHQQHIPVAINYRVGVDITIIATNIDAPGGTPGPEAVGSSQQRPATAEAQPAPRCQPSLERHAMCADADSMSPFVPTLVCFGLACVSACSVASRRLRRRVASVMEPF